MSLLTPEKLPVKVYKWDDVGAPALDKTANCVTNIFKTCLVTGYGIKEGAGWTVPFEDANIKVLRPPESPHNDFYLKLSADTGTQMTAQVYQNMTSISNGDLKLQSDQPFKYNKAQQGTKWALIATSRGFFFFNNQYYVGTANQTGSYFYLNTNVSNKGLLYTYLHHAGGTADNGNHVNPLSYQKDSYQSSPALSSPAKILLDNNSVVSAVPKSLSSYNGFGNVWNEFILSPIGFSLATDVFIMPWIYTSANGVTKNNFDVVTVADAESVRQMLVFGLGTNGESNFYIPTDYWSY